MGWRAVGVMALVWPMAVFAQDVTLSSRQGEMSVSGTLTSYDGAFYRIDSSYGPLTLDAEGVDCDGPGCPDMMSPKTPLRIMAAPGLGEVLLPALIEAFAKTRGLVYVAGQGPDYTAELRNKDGEGLLAEVSLTIVPLSQALAEATAGKADLVIAANAEAGFTTKVLALDAMVPVVSAENHHPQISTADLAKVLAGAVTNWSQVGGPDKPLVLHGLSETQSLQQALIKRLGQAPVSGKTHPDLASLQAGLAQDPWGIAIGLRHGIDGLRVLPLTDGCGLRLASDPMAVKAQDYPLVLAAHLLLPKRHSSRVLRDFIDFLSTTAAQEVIRSQAWIDQSPQMRPLAEDGPRLITALQQAKPDSNIKTFRSLVDMMAQGQRSSYSFRFEGSGNVLDAQSKHGLDELAKLMEIDQFSAYQPVFVGFVSGNRQGGQELSEARAAQVAKALKGLVPQSDPRSIGFGGLLPMGCHETMQGRQMNDRVELWFMPKDTPQPGN